MKYLLDVNVLLAWGWSDHVDHERTAAWIAGMKKRKSDTLLTSAIPQLGFVRISVQWAAGRVTVSEAGETLAGMLKSLGSRHVFLADDVSALMFPEWCYQASLTTDAHLLQLAQTHGAKLATLDTGIPNAFVIPLLT
jgi:predicted nucleic acid-binding protein